MEPSLSESATVPLREAPFKDPSGFSSFHAGALQGFSSLQTISPLGS